MLVLVEFSQKGVLVLVLVLLKMGLVLGLVLVLAKKKRRKKRRRSMFWFWSLGWLRKTNSPTVRRMAVRREESWIEL